MASNKRMARPVDERIPPNVRKVLVAVLGVDEVELTPDSKLVDDLGADSLDLVELSMALEEEFGVSLPEHVVEPWALATIAELLASLTKAGAKV
jgi:acyl carrier protein